MILFEETYSLSTLRSSLAELEKDLAAFRAARQLLYARLREARDVGWQLDDWVGTDAVLGSLELATAHVENRLKEVKINVERIVAGELLDLDATTPGTRN